jgi:hypothetical protein
MSVTASFLVAALPLPRDRDSRRASVLDDDRCAVTVLEQPGADTTAAPLRLRSRVGDERRGLRLEVLACNEFPRIAVQEFVPRVPARSRWRKSLQLPRHVASLHSAPASLCLSERTKPGRVCSSVFDSGAHYRAQGKRTHGFASLTAKNACSSPCFRNGTPVTVCSYKWVRSFGAGAAIEPSNPRGEGASDCVPVSAQKIGAARGGVRFANARQPVSSARIRSTPRRGPTLASALPSAASGHFGMSLTRSTSRRPASWWRTTCSNSTRRGEERGRRNPPATPTHPWPSRCGTRCAASSPSSTGVTTERVNTAGRASQCAGARSTAQLGVA